MKIRSYLATLLLLVFLAASSAVTGARLTVRQYTSSDGLVSDSVNRIVSDSKGFLWICTSEGLSRFDGYSFRNYTTEQGLPHSNIHDLLETAEGEYLVATSNGLAVFDPGGKPTRWDPANEVGVRNGSDRPMFSVYFPDKNNSLPASRVIRRLAADKNGTIYAATPSGVFRLIGKGSERRLLKFASSAFGEFPQLTFNSLHEDKKGRVWVTTDKAVFLVSPDGNVVKVIDGGGNSVWEDSKGRYWIDSGGDDTGIRVVRDTGPVPEQERLITTRDGLAANQFANALAELPDGSILGASGTRMFRFVPAGDGTSGKILPLDNEADGAEWDREGNLWFASPGNGISRYSPSGFSVYDERDGLDGEPISSIFTASDGTLMFTSGADGLYRVEDDGIVKVMPGGFESRSWGSNHLILESSDGGWWVTSRGGLLKYSGNQGTSALDGAAPTSKLTTSDGIKSDEIFGAFEDSRGDVWITSVASGVSLQKLDRRSGKILSFTREDGLPENDGPISFAEDKAGNVWISFYFGELIRYRNGKFQSMNEPEGMPKGFISRIFADREGRLWFATSSRGLFVADDPGSERPVFRNISTTSGLASNSARCVTEDSSGRIYAGTGRGVVRMAGDGTVTRIFTRADGLPGESVSFCHTDSEGTLWFAANDSLASFRPEGDEKNEAPPVLIDAIEINGDPFPVPELGVTDAGSLELGSDQRQVRIGFLAIAPGSGESVRFQYKLGDQEWSGPSTQRTVSFNLSPGTHEFVVRAVTADGAAAASSAKVALHIAHPFWQRWWFIAGVFLFFAAGVLALDRYRVSKTREVESALARSRDIETRLRTLADTASDAILTIDEDSMIVFANEAAVKIFGYSSEDLVGSKLTDLMPERMREGHGAGIRRFLDTRERSFSWSGVELTGLRKDGSEVPLEVSFGHFELGGRSYFTGVARDISERKRSQQLLNEAKEEKLVELERIRKRIASDLHDDIGSSLTQIAVLSEVARNQAASGAPDELERPLESIKSVSKELVEVMSDIVWAINPSKDYLHDLVQRMRRFGSDVLAGNGVRFDFEAPGDADHLQLGANIRREVFSIFKEAVTNAARHSGCSRVSARLAVDAAWLTLELEDDGRGFDTASVLSDNFNPDTGGNGLISISNRAGELGGSFVIESETGNGTRFSFRIPLHGPQPENSDTHPNG